MMRRAILFLVCIGWINTTRSQTVYTEQYRPQIHFSPKEHWMNDPNGMIYNNGIYHLFFQYFPGGTVWGPMHWGHATSKDLIHWQQRPIALYPDSLGYIFSGSAVLDKNNTSGFAKNGKIPLVAIYTNHDPKGEKSGTKTFQNQSIAYSLDNGKTWVKYPGNPVLKNPGISDFRDPKVMWHSKENKWVMTLATKDRITFYSSKDLKHWKKESEFGENEGAHGGVWECPDLFPLKYQGKTIWVLIVNLNPGGPNKGSATQYFTGDFDGSKFTSNSSQTKWLDYGPDEYAGVTWNNTGDRRIFLGWMSNWLYANEVPTIKWRNAMTIPRKLDLRKVGNEIYITSEPIAQRAKIKLHSDSAKNISLTRPFDIAVLNKNNIHIPCRIDLETDKINNFSIVLSNDIGEKLIIGYDKESNHYFIDRILSGNVNFNKEFADTSFAPRLIKTNQMDISILVDESSVELFADGGLSAMTAIFFPTKPYNHIKVTSGKNVTLQELKYTTYKSIWH